MKFTIKDFLSKCDQIRSSAAEWSFMKYLHNTIETIIFFKDLAL